MWRFRCRDQSVFVHVIYPVHGDELQRFQNRLNVWIPSWPRKNLLAIGTTAATLQGRETCRSLFCRDTSSLQFQIKLYRSTSSLRMCPDRKDCDTFFFPQGQRHKPINLLSLLLCRMFKLTPFSSATSLNHCSQDSSCYVHRIVQPHFLRFPLVRRIFFQVTTTLWNRHQNYHLDLFKSRVNCYLSSISVFSTGVPRDTGVPWVDCRCAVKMFKGH